MRIKRGIIFLGIVVAIGFLVFFYQSDIDESDVSVWIVATDSGEFEPSRVTVNEGDVVGWRNESSEPIWPASNLHPDHTVYPEFDAFESVDPGEYWLFKFNKRGEWRYHDHLGPANTGVVAVE